MSFKVREMLNDELEIPINYFHESTLEHLQMLGVDPTKLPDRKKWLEYSQTDVQKPYEQRSNILLLWLDDEKPIGFSTADTIDYGHSAKMHLHVLKQEV